MKMDTLINNIGKKAEEAGKAVKNFLFGTGEDSTPTSQAPLQDSKLSKPSTFPAATGDPSLNSTEVDSKSFEKLSTPKIIELSGLALKRLKDAKLSLTLEESTECLMEYIRFGTEQAKEAKGKDIIFFLGNTGAGKSTTINYLHGCTMEAVKKKDIGLKGAGKVVRVKPDSEIKELKSIAIGHGKESQTFMPIIASDENLTYCDCPGFFDSRGAEVNIANLVNIKNTLQSARSVKVIVVISHSSLQADRGKSVTDLVKIITHLFGLGEQLTESSSTPLRSVLIGVTQLRMEEEPTLLEIQEEIFEGSEEIKSMSSILRPNVFIFDPTEKDKLEGALERRQLVDKITHVPELKDLSVFKIPLDEQSKLKLQDFSKEIGKKIQYLLKEKAFRKVFDYLNSVYCLQVTESLLIKQQYTKNIREIFEYIKENNLEIPIEDLYQDYNFKDERFFKLVYELLIKIEIDIARFFNAIDEEISRTTNGKDVLIALDTHKGVDKLTNLLEMREIKAGAQGVLKGLLEAKKLEDILNREFSEKFNEVKKYKKMVGEKLNKLELRLIYAALEKAVSKLATVFSEVIQGYHLVFENQGDKVLQGNKILQRLELLEQLKPVLDEKEKKSSSRTLKFKQTDDVDLNIYLMYLGKILEINKLLEIEITRILSQETGQLKQLLQEINSYSRRLYRLNGHEEYRHYHERVISKLDNFKDHLQREEANGYIRLVEETLNAEDFKKSKECLLLIEKLDKIQQGGWEKLGNYVKQSIALYKRHLEENDYGSTKILYMRLLKLNKVFGKILPKHHIELDLRDLSQMFVDKMLRLKKEHDEEIIKAFTLEKLRNEYELIHTQLTSTTHYWNLVKVFQDDWEVMKEFAECKGEHFDSVDKLSIISIDKIKSCYNEIAQQKKELALIVSAFFIQLRRVGDATAAPKILNFSKEITATFLREKQQKQDDIELCAQIAQNLENRRQLEKVGRYADEIISEHSQFKLSQNKLMKSKLQAKSGQDILGELKMTDNKELVTGFEAYNKEYDSILSEIITKSAISDAEGYDLVLMFINEEQEVKISQLDEFLRKNKQLLGKPILIKQDHAFILYGQSKSGEWQLTDGLDANPLEQLPFSNHPARLSTSLEQEELIVKLSIFTARKDEILRKKECGESHSRLEEELEVRLKDIQEIEEQLIQDSKDQNFLKEQPAISDSPPQTMIPVPTKGGGDCALHAVLGVWNPCEKQIVCSDVKEKREKMRAAIIGKDNQEPLQTLIIDGMKELMMSGRDIGESSRKLRSQYQQFLSDQKDLDAMSWSTFEEILRKNQVIIEYIRKNHRLNETSSLRDQFYDALNRKEGELYGRILSLPELNEAFKEYSQLQNTAFDWSVAISELKGIKEEYADFVGTSQVWLLPSELAIIAHIFNIRVIYYPSAAALPLTLNPEGSSTVEVQFDDIGHFERLQLPEYQSVFILPAGQIPKEVYQEITLKKGHTPAEKIKEMLIKDAKKNAQEFSKEVIREGDRLTYSQIGGLLLANIFGAWSYLDVQDTSRGEFKRDRTTVLEPHPMQIISILLLLGIGGNKQLINQFIQVRTGEGKSLIAAGVAIALALMNYKVDVACYSDYLSTRDYNYFKKLFILFGVSSAIRYAGFDNLMESRMHRMGDIRKLAEQLLSRKIIESKEIDSKGEKGVLLVDEVDVFFSKNFLGKAIYPIVPIYDDDFRSLLIKIWEGRNSFLKNPILFKNTIISDPLMKKFLKKYPHAEKFLQHTANEIIESLKSVAAGHHIYTVHPRRPESTDIKVADNYQEGIGYVDPETGNINFHICDSYKTPFAYIKENSRFSPGILKLHVAFRLSLGAFSYTELPKVYKPILGVSGTLECLSEPEKSIVNEYKIEKMQVMPSLFKKKSLNEGRYTAITLCAGDRNAEDKRGFFYNIRQKTKEMTDKDRAVLVVFENTERLEEFKTYLATHPLGISSAKCRYLSEHSEHAERDAIIADGATCGQVTLLTKLFGRGSDFICRDSALRRNGGVHVLQTFFSEHESEEIQIRGRTCRQDDPGSYEMVLFLNDLQKYGVSKESDLSQFIEDIKETQEAKKGSPPSYFLPLNVEEDDDNLEAKLQEGAKKLVIDKQLSAKDAYAFLFFRQRLFCLHLKKGESTVKKEIILKVGSKVASLKELIENLFGSIPLRGSGRLLTADQVKTITLNTNYTVGTIAPYPDFLSQPTHLQWYGFLQTKRIDCLHKETHSLMADIAKTEKRHKETLQFMSLFATSKRKEQIEEDAINLLLKFQ